MKLSVIYQHKDSESRKTIDNIAAQLNDDCELIIATQSKGTIFNKYKAAAEGKKIRAVKQEANNPLDFKNALKVAQGAYIAFVFEDDEVSDDYIEKVLAAIDGGDAAYYPLKWQFVNWHKLVFMGGIPLPYWFTNICKKDIAIKLKEKNGVNNLYGLLAKCEKGEPIDEVIYMHWR